MPCTFEWLPEHVTLADIAYEVSGKKDGEDGTAAREWKSFKSYESGNFIENTFRWIK